MFFTYLTFLSFFVFAVLVHDSECFKCVADGIFEDDNDCHSYFECLWVGTPLEKQEHVRCHSGLVFNSIKHRCDTVFEYKSHLLNHGIRTKQDLVELIRFSNCIGHNLLQNLTKPTAMSRKTSLTNGREMNRSFRKIIKTKEKESVVTATTVTATTTTAATTTTTTKPSKSHGVFADQHHKHNPRNMQNLDRQLELVVEQNNELLRQVKAKVTTESSSSAPSLKMIGKLDFGSIIFSSEKIFQKSEGEIFPKEFNETNAYKPPLKAGGVFRSRKLLSIEQTENDNIHNKIEEKQGAKKKRRQLIRLSKSIKSSRRYEILKELVSRKKAESKERTNRGISATTFTTTKPTKPSIATTTAKEEASLSNHTIAATTVFIKMNSTVNPHMQTYKINQTKKLLGSLKMESSVGISKGETSGGVSNLTTISEIERGAKFQRLRLAPADTLIECKENDFGLECSCSIT